MKPTNTINRTAEKVEYVCACGHKKMMSPASFRLIYRGKPYICVKCSDKQYEGRPSIPVYF